MVFARLKRWFSRTKLVVKTEEVKKEERKSRKKEKAKVHEDEVGTQFHSRDMEDDFTGDIVENESKRDYDSECITETNHEGDEDNVVNEDQVEVKEVKGNEEEEQEEELELESGDCGNDEECEEDDGFVGEFVFEEQPKSFSCLSPDEIVAYQEKEIKEIADLLSISPSISATLLRHFQWKREKLLMKYFENPSRVCQDAGVPYTPAHTLGHAASSSSAPLKLSKNNNSVHMPANMCSICADDELTSQSSSSLSCGHVFCNVCWVSYLTTKITEGQPQMRCPQVKCNLHVDDIFIKKLVPSPVFNKYLQFVTKSFVQENDEVRWCPTPGCNNAITFDQSSSSSDSSIVKCSCGFRFCFKCHREAHAPATCDQMKSWEQKCQDDSETFNWKSVNCRECPKCDVAVEKNGGCNHMTCRQCKYEWCWVCMRAWKGHDDFYTCNRFEKEMLAAQKKKMKKSKRKTLEDEKEKKRNALERYLHYYERFVNHDNSRKLEIELKAKAKLKMQELHDVDATWAEVQFIEKAVDVLQECRCVLKYTYVFAYYFVEEGKQYAGAAKELFEFLQEDLEITTEKLSEIMEEVLKKNEIEHTQKLETINQTNLARTKLGNLLVGEGTTS